NRPVRVAAFASAAPRRWRRVIGPAPKTVKPFFGKNCRKNAKTSQVRKSTGNGAKQITDHWLKWAHDFYTAPWNASPPATETWRAIATGSDGIRGTYICMQIDAGIFRSARADFPADQHGKKWQFQQAADLPCSCHCRLASQRRPSRAMA
ncbi:hypothetical protein, partial [Thalassospira sp. MCCC 1A02491]|uniref:hypothetical protein n=1 Tax=Thalassospira sp. MCCC 1A02491 TaxID=1769751 RepID=UPI001E507BF8